MSNPRIEVEIGAKVDPSLAKGLNDAERATKSYAKNIDALRTKFDSSNGSITNLKNSISSLKGNLENATEVRSIAKYNIRLDQAQKELERLTSVGLRAGNALQRVGANNATQGINRLSKATSTYNGIGIEFSRIIQDAPFGIIGIGNNIQQLAGNFQQLRASSSSTGAALKTAFASIISPANLLVLGISVLTSVLTVLSAKGFFKTSESAEDAEEALDKYRKTLDAVTQASIKGQANAAKEIGNFNLLKSQAENVLIPLNKRIEAVDDLQKSYPDYLGNLSQEQILTGEVGTSYDQLSKSLIATAKARAANDEIASNSLKLLTLETKKIELETKKLTEEQIKSIEATKGQVTGLSGISDQFGKQQAARSENFKLDQELKKIAQETNAIKERETQLLSFINEQITAGAIFTEEKAESASKLNKLLGKEKILREQIAGIQAPGKSTQDFQSAFSPKKIDGTGTGLGFADQFNLANANLADSVSNAPGLSLEKIFPSVIDFESFIKDLLEGYADVLDKEIPTFAERVKGLVASVNDTFVDRVPDSIENFSLAIGAALANGGNVIEAIGTSLLSSMAKFLGEFGKNLISFGFAGLAFGKLSVALTNPFTAVGAAPLAIAAGIALTALSGAIGSIGNKGLGGGGGSGSSGVGSGGTFTGSGSNSFDPMRMFKIEVVGSISGEAIGFALAQGQNRKN